MFDLNERVGMLVHDPPAVVFPARDVRGTSLADNDAAPAVEALDPLHMHEVAEGVVRTFCQDVESDAPLIL